MSEFRSFTEAVNNLVEGIGTLVGPIDEVVFFLVMNGSVKRFEYDGSVFDETVIEVDHP